MRFNQKGAAKPKLHISANENGEAEIEGNACYKRRTSIWVSTGSKEGFLRYYSK